MSRRIESDFSGDKVNCIAQASSVELHTVENTQIITFDDSVVLLATDLQSRVRLLACVTTPETMREHFDSHGWASPGDQIRAGYRRYIEPTPTDGTYDEVFDFGPYEIEEAKVTVTFDHKRIEGAVQVLVGMAVFPSTDYVYGSVQTLQNFTKIRVHIHFKGTDTRSLIDISTLAVNVEET